MNMELNETIIRSIVAESLRNVLSEKKVLKLKKKSSQPNTNAAPTDMPPMDDPMAGGAAPMGGGEAPMDAPMDNAPMGGGDAPMDAPMGGPDMNGGEPPMDDPMGGPSMDDRAAPMGGEEPSSDGGDSTMDIINKLSDTDREAVRAYAESMLSRDEGNNGDNGESNGPEGFDPAMGMGGEPTGQGEPMMETVIFTKGQLRHIYENFGPNAAVLDKDERKPLEKKKAKQVSKNSPFNAPRFK